MNLHEEYLKQSMDRLSRLKVNIHTHAISQYIDLLRSKWRPQTKTIVGTIPHGSKKGDEVINVVYYDEYNHTWTTEDIAFKGYVFNQITKIINKK